MEDKYFEVHLNITHKRISFNEKVRMTWDYSSKVSSIPEVYFLKMPLLLDFASLSYTAMPEENGIVT